MSNLIDKAAIISQLTTEIGNLNVATETTDELLIYLKTAMNAGISATDIVDELEDRLDGMSVSDNARELSLLLVSLSLITEDRMPAVNGIGGLDVNISPGSIYFIESQNAPYIKKKNGDWVPVFKDKKKTNAYAWGGWRIYKGTGKGEDRLSPDPVLGGITDFIQISTKWTHTLGLRANGTIWAWGNNTNGQIGDNTLAPRSSPVLVGGGFTDWIQVSAGQAHSLGLRANGTLWSWGFNETGELGDGTTTQRSSPVSVVGGFTDWIQVSAGRFHSLGIRANGTAWAWGNGEFGRLGTNNTTNRSSPVAVVGGFTDWTQLSAGSSYSLGLRANGTLWSWGFNGQGRLGDGTTTSRSSPVSVVGGFTNWVYVDAGVTSHGIRSDGTLWSWGRNEHGVLGDGTTTSRSSPVSVIGGFTDWIQVSTGDASLIFRQIQAIRASSD